MGGASKVVISVLAGICITSAAEAESVNAVTSQAEVPAKSAQPAVSDEGGIEDIVVVAQKRSERLQDVPLAVSAVTEDSLEKAGVESIQDLSQVVPNLMAVRNFTSGGIFATLRGVGTVIGLAGFENSVAVYLDGVYAPSTNGSTLSLNNVERIEVLKGPQGTLFGRNATGGVINIITRDPSHDFSGKLKLGYDSYETAEASFYVTGGLTPDIAIDFAGLYQSQGKPYGRNVATGEDFLKNDYEYLLRSKLLWTPGETTRILLIGDYAGSKGDVGFYTPVPNPPVAGLFPKPIQDSEYDGAFNSGTGRRFRGGGVSAQLEQEIGDLTLIDVFSWRDMTAWSYFDPDQTAVPAQFGANEQYDRQLSNEIRLQSSGSGSFTWLVGAYYLRYRSGYDPFVITLGGPLAPLPTSLRSIAFRAGQLTNSYALFGQGSIKIGEGTTLTAGLRYSSDKVRRYGSQLLTFNNGFTSPGGTAALPAEAKYDKVTWRLSVDHRFNDQVMIYASANRGFKTGGFNVTGTDDSEGYKPETLDAYEVGLKSDPIPGVVRLNLAAFYYDLQNPQMQIIPVNVALTRNAPKAEIYGVDADLSVHPTDGLRIDLGLGWNHGRYGTFTDAPFYLGCPVGAALPCAGDATGNRLAAVPDWMLTGGVNYEVPLASGGSLEFNGNVSYMSSKASDAAATYIEDEYAVAKSSVTWHLPGDQFSIRAYVDNITDNRSFRRVSISTIGGTNGARNNPRTFGVSATAAF